MKVKVEGEIEVDNSEEVGHACARLFEEIKKAGEAGGLAPEHVTVHWPSILSDEPSQAHNSPRSMPPVRSQW